MIIIDDEETAIKMSKSYSFSYVTYRLSDRLKDDEALLTLLLAESMYETLEFISARLRGKKDFIEFAITRNSYVCDISDELKDDAELMLSTIKQSSYDYACISNRLKESRDFAITVAKIAPHIIFMMYAEFQDDIEIARLAILDDTNNLKYVSDRLKKLGRDYIRNYKYYERIHDNNFQYFEDIIIIYK